MVTSNCKIWIAPSSIKERQPKLVISLSPPEIGIDVCLANKVVCLLSSAHLTGSSSQVGFNGSNNLQA